MPYQVTPWQYAMLIGARDNWPDRLTSGDYFDDKDDTKTCAVGHLAFNAGLRATREEKPDYAGLVSSVYGVPRDVLYMWEDRNDWLYFLPGERRRSRGMLRRFQEFLDEVEVVPETYADKPSEEVYSNTRK